MKVWVLLSLFWYGFAESQPVVKFMPRSEAVVRIVLGHHGPSATHANLVGLKGLLEQKFFQATQGRIRLEVIDEVTLADEASVCRDGAVTLSEPRFQHLSSQRKSRLRYYYSQFGLARYLFEQTEARIAKTSQADLVVVTTDAQFDALAYQSNKMIVAEFPSEAAWALPDGGLTIFSSAEELADRLLHEIGHGLGLLHSAEHCSEMIDPARPETLEQSKQCCLESPSKDDLMSYCRDRTKPRFIFAECSMKYLETTVVPKLLRGGYHEYQTTPCP